ncbi:MAG: hypothetical protein AAB608_02665 [Patescibacteria group bacterium]
MNSAYKNGLFIGVIILLSAGAFWVARTLPSSQPSKSSGSTGSLRCIPVYQSVLAGDTVTLSAFGGSGNYTWVAEDAEDSSGSGSIFTTRYTQGSVDGDPQRKPVVVRSGDDIAFCEVYVTEATFPQEATTPPLRCIPLYQALFQEQTARIVATGGSGTYTWSAGSSTPSSATGAVFNTTPQAGTVHHTVRISASGAIAECGIGVIQTPLP